jgi:hypothetical protein
VISARRYVCIFGTVVSTGPCLLGVVFVVGE